MQTQPRPTENEIIDQDQKDLLVSSEAKKRKVIRGLNLGIVFVGVILYVLYLTKGAEIYSHIPGGRKFLLPFALFVLLVLLATRIYASIGRKKLVSTPRRFWHLNWVRFWTPVSLIFIVAFGLRLWGINFGLPYLEQVDEWAVADRALHIVQTGNYDPLDYRNPALPDNDRQAFTYPTLYTYMETAVFSAKFLQGVAADKYSAVSNITTSDVKPDFYLWGRALTALLGALTAVLVYFVAANFYGRKVGLVAALFMSFFYLNVLNSHFITTDVPSGFFVLLPFLFIWPILQGKDSWKIYAAAGLLAGLAVATKYNNGLILVPVLAAHLLGRPPRRWFSWNFPLACVTLLFGFLVGAPFVAFHLPNFLTDVAEIINHYQNLGHTGYQGDNNWLYYLQSISYENIVILVLALGGIGLAFIRHQRRDIVLLTFPLISYLQLSSYKVNFTRNLMPIIPFLAIFGGLLTVELIEWVFNFSRKRLFTLGQTNRLQNLAISGLALLAVIGPAFSIVNYDTYNAKQTTRTLATNWAAQNLPQGSKIWLEPGSLDLLPANSFQLSGGDSVLAHPFDWYASNNYNYIVLSEVTYKNLYQKGDKGYKSLIDGPLPNNLTSLKSFRHDANQPGPTIIILSTGLPVVTNSVKTFAIEKSLDLSFREFKLVGLDLPSTVKIGAKLPIVLYWQTTSTIQINYTTFLHLLDDKNQIVAQVDIMPLSNTRPTSLWKPGEVLRDPYTLSLSSKVQPGLYHLHVGLYNAANGARLQTSDGQDEVDVGEVTVQ